MFPVHVSESALNHRDVIQWYSVQRNYFHVTKAITWIVHIRLGTPFLNILYGTFFNLLSGTCYNNCQRTLKPLTPQKNNSSWQTICHTADQLSRYFMAGKLQMGHQNQSSKPACTTLKHVLVKNSLKLKYWPWEINCGHGHHGDANLRTTYLLCSHCSGWLTHPSYIL